MVPRLLQKLGGNSKTPLFIFSLILFSCSMMGEVWSVLSPSWPLFIFWNCFTMRFISSLSWIWLATIVFSSSWVLICSLAFWCSSHSTKVTESSNLLSLGLSCESNIGLWCWSCGVPSMRNGFSTVMGLELELTWLSFFDSLRSLPSDLNQIFP